MDQRPARPGPAAHRLHPRHNRTQDHSTAPRPPHRLDWSLTARSGHAACATGTGPTLGASISTDLITGPDWPMLADTIQRAHDAGYDLDTRLPALVAEQPLPDQRPAHDLHYRLIQAVPEAAQRTSGPVDAAATDQAARQRLQLAAKNSTTGTDTADSASGPAPKRHDDRWRSLVEGIDPRLTQDDGWLALAATLHRAAERGMDVESELPRLVAEGPPLPDRRAAQELQYRVIAAADIAPTSYNPPRDVTPTRRARPEPPPSPATTHDRPHGPSR